MGKNINFRTGYVIRINGTGSLNDYVSYHDEHRGYYNTSNHRANSKIFISIDSATDYILSQEIFIHHEGNIDICNYKCINNIPITIIKKHSFSHIHRRMKIEKLLNK